MMKIDVIIPVYRPSEKLKKMLCALTEQTLRPVQIILMHTEDGCDLSYAKEVCGDIPVQEIMVAKESFDHGGTRDIAIRKAKSEVVVLMTQDAIPLDQKLFEYLADALCKDKAVAAAYARQIAGKECTYTERYTRQFNYPKESRIKSRNDLGSLGIKTYFCSNVCAAYRRDTYMQLGGFEKEIIFNEDMVYAANAIEHGYKIAYVAEAVVEHAHDYTSMQQFRRNFDQGVSQADYPQIFKNVKSETEGIKLVKQTAWYLLENKKIFQMIRMIILSGCKYLGYKCGRNYRKLPKWLIQRMTMNVEYWKRRENRDDQ